MSSSYSPVVNDVPQARHGSVSQLAGLDINGIISGVSVEVAQASASVPKVALEVPTILTRTITFPRGCDRYCTSIVELIQSSRRHCKLELGPAYDDSAK